MREGDGFRKSSTHPTALHQPSQSPPIDCGLKPQQNRQVPPIEAPATLERDEFGFAPPSIQSPFIPAKAGIQGPELSQRTGSPLPRGRAELRGAIQVQLILLQRPILSGTSEGARMRKDAANPAQTSPYLP